MKSSHSSPKVAVTMLGARMHYAVPRIFQQHNMLERFFTDSYIGNKPLLETLLRVIPQSVAPSAIQRWLGRKDLILSPDKVTSFEFLGLWYVLARKCARTYSQTEAVYREVAHRFSAAVLREGFGEASVVWGFNNASRDIFRAAKAQGKFCILEQTILPIQLELKLMREEVLRWPGWQPGLDIPEDDPDSIRWAEEEWGLADMIIAGSDFVRDGLVLCGVDPEKIRVVPYGVDVARFSPAPRRMRSNDEPLRVLFVGEVGLRKGVPDLLHALAQVGPDKVQALFAGHVALDIEKLRSFEGVAEFLGVVPRVQMAELYRWADVFVLPSIVEGSATVTYEALLSGLPVLTTPNSGSIVRDSVDGTIVDCRSVESISKSILLYADNNSYLDNQRENSRKKRYFASFDRYSDQLISLFNDNFLDDLGCR